MKKLFTSLAVVAMAATSQACASFGGYTGFTGLSIPGYEAASLVAANSAMPYQFLATPGWIYHGQPAMAAPPGYQWACRPVSFMHKLGDAGLAALVGNFFGWRGAGAGAGVGGYIANHEKDCYLVAVQPTPQP